MTTQLFGATILSSRAREKAAHLANAKSNCPSTKIRLTNLNSRPDRVVLLAARKPSA